MTGRKEKTANRTISTHFMIYFYVLSFCIYDGQNYTLLHLKGELFKRENNRWQIINLQQHGR